VTWVFQEIVNTYGVPTYKEINPSVFAIVTFPFLFGIMFGDIGHGFVLFLIGALLCLLSDFIRAKAPGMEAVLGMRYILLLMGIFSTFSGFIYNDLMAMPLYVWDSCYTITKINSNSNHDDMLESVPFKAVPIPGCVYPVGLDPMWHLGINELAFNNSLKMKLSVILGVLQMGLGVCMKALNAAYFKNKLDLIYEFVPQIILLFVLFGYMDIMIVLKWTTDFTHKESTAPSIISNMIDMALNGGAIAPGTVALFKSQQVVSILFLLIAIVVVPIMLFPKPFIILNEMKHHAEQAHHDDAKNVESIALKDQPAHVDAASHGLAS
jgi:V-type H+-transporting ATPase subunit a